MATTFFDVETPNRRNDRICSIGVIRKDECGVVEYKKHILVNPEADFDYINISIHGIVPEDVEGAPTFDELWEDELGAVFQGAVVVAHNATFDLAVLDKSLARYRFEAQPTDYICTMRAAQACGVPVPNYKLPTLCRYFGVVLDHHHNALSDASACEGVFTALQSAGFSRSMPSSRYIYKYAR